MKKKDAKPAGSFRFTSAEIAAAKAAAGSSETERNLVDWTEGIVTPGGGVRATMEKIRTALEPKSITPKPPRRP